MNHLVKKEWNEFEIQFEEVNGQLMANATLICTTFSKKLKDWLRIEKTKAYIRALKSKGGNSPATLVDIRAGGNSTGTWINKKLILKLAQWLNNDFEIQCNE